MTARKKTKTLKRKATTKKLSAPIIQDLRLLSEQIGKIIPATSFGKGAFCFSTIATKLGLKKYWLSASKKEAIFGFLSNVYKRHPKLFYRVFREHLAQGIERRHRNGDPVLKAEINELNSTLKRLGINLSSEINKLNLPATRPAIVPPPFVFKKIVDDLSFHLFLQPDCPNLFKNGHINESARKALEKFELYVQKKSGLAGLIGTDLMAQAFNEKAPKIKLFDTLDRRGEGLQAGIKFMTMGAMSFWRNYLSHGDEDQIPHQDALAIMGIVSHLLHYIDNNTI